MQIGERLKKRRKELGLSVESIAEQLGVSYTTLYRYEASSISKIPIETFDKLCKILNTTPAELMGNDDSGEENRDDLAKLPAHFENPQEAIEFILKTPTLAAFGGYDPSQMDEETIVEFANELLGHLKVMSYRYQKKGASENEQKTGNSRSGKSIM